ncbi:hypothetical protein WJX72_003429 [[Myrmecia] bisecta]|uniref:C3H1-type domain-containing protein n=1 Tax=[Myrmecia] bisecta TaxID=41462 RepID=A0AAW1Q6U7_9CHLO
MAWAPLPSLEEIRKRVAAAQASRAPDQPVETAGGYAAAVIGAPVPSSEKRKAPAERVVEVGFDAEVRQWRREQNKLRRQEGHQGGRKGEKRQRRDPGKQSVYALDTTERPKQPCRFFKQGRCSKGADCPFPHVGEPVTRFICCRYFKQGSCMKGALCEYSHDLSSEPCKNMVLHGTCAFGDRCSYSHAPLEDGDDAAALKEYFLEMERLRANLGLDTAVSQQTSGGTAPMQTAEADQAQDALAAANRFGLSSSNAQRCTGAGGEQLAGAGPAGTGAGQPKVQPSAAELLRTALARG